MIRGLVDSGGYMKTIWYVIYLTILGMVAFMLPFAQFFYETDDDKTFGKRILEALCYESIYLAIMVTLLMVGFTFLNIANIPVSTITIPFS